MNIKRKQKAKRKARGGRRRRGRRAERETNKKAIASLIVVTLAAFSVHSAPHTAIEIAPNVGGSGDGGESARARAREAMHLTRAQCYFHCLRRALHKK